MDMQINSYKVYDAHTGENEKVEEVKVKPSSGSDAKSNEYPLHNRATLDVAAHHATLQHLALSKIAHAA
ncbi:MAG: hypothetical protein Q8K75_05670 [Chlamydiales bacterium]|nr:hypothetical protein [Chlamydiales bacterium]